MQKTDQIELQKLSDGFQKKYGSKLSKAILGDINGRIYEPGRPGYVRVRYVGSAGFSDYVTVRLQVAVNPVVGNGVLIGYDNDGELAVVGLDFAGMESQGNNPGNSNPSDPNQTYFIQQQRLLTFVCHPVSSAADSMLVAVQTGTVVDLATDTFTLFFGSQEDLTSFIPGGAGEWCLACLFWKTDNSIEIFASTPKDNPDDLGIDDINECFAARSSGSLPIWAWRLYNGQTGIASGAPADGGDDYMDLRPLFFMLQSSGGGSGITQLTGDVTAGPGSGSQAATLATVNGNVGSFTNANITVNGKGLITAASSGTASPWTTDSNVVNLVTDGDVVTVGSATALGKLGVDGDADEVQLVVQGNATQTALLAVFEDSAGNDQVTISGDGAVVINEEGNDADFRVEGDTDTDLIHVDASTDRVGIGTATPAAKLDVRGSVSINTDNGNNDFIVDGQTENDVLVVDASRNAVGIGIATPSTNAILQVFSTTKGFLLPKMTDTQRIAMGAVTEALLVYDTNFQHFYAYIGGWDSVVLANDGQTLTNKTLTSPAISNFTNAQHDHLDADDGGTLDAAAIASGTIAEARLPTTLSRYLFSLGADVTVASPSVAETTITGTGLGSLTIPAAALNVVGAEFEIRAQGYATRAAGNTTIRVKVGGTTIFTFGASATAWGTNNRFEIYAKFTTKTTGATGTIKGGGYVDTFTAVNAFVRNQFVATGATTLDLTGTLAVDVTWQWSNAAGQSVTCTNLDVIQIAT